MKHLPSRTYSRYWALHSILSYICATDCVNIGYRMQYYACFTNEKYHISYHTIPYHRLYLLEQFLVHSKIEWEEQFPLPLPAHT